MQKTVSIKIHKQDDSPPVVSLTASPATISVHSEEEGTKKTEQTVTFTAIITDNVTTYSNLSITLATASLLPRTAEDEANNRVRFQKTYKYSDALLNNIVPNNEYTDTLQLIVLDGGYYGNNENRNRTEKTVNVIINKVDNTDPSITEILINEAARANDEFSIDLKSEGTDNTKLVTFHVTPNDAQSSISQVSVSNSGVGGVVTPLTRTAQDIADGKYRFSKTYDYSNYTALGFGNNVAQDEVTFQAKDVNGNTADRVATIKINKEDITIPNPPIFSPASGSQTVTISTNHPTQTINIDVEATDDDSGVNRVVMQRPATDNRGIVTGPSSNFSNKQRI